MFRKSKKVYIQNKVKPSYAEKFLRKSDFLKRKRVRDKSLRIDRRLKDLWSNL